MPTTLPTKDRFDDLTLDHGRVGAHRAENPRMRGSRVLLWSALATVVLVAAGIVGMLYATGRFTPLPEPGSSAAPAPAQTAEPVLDTSYRVTILNATSQAGLAGEMRDALVAQGWSEDNLTPGDAGSEGFATTTVFYSTREDEGAARGLAEAIGGAPVELSDAYAGFAGEDGAPQLVIVIGLDRVAAS